MRIVTKALLLSAASLALAGGAHAATCAGPTTYTGATTYFYMTGSYNSSFRISTGDSIGHTAPTATDPGNCPDINGFAIVNAVGTYPGDSSPYYADVTFFTDQNGNAGGLEIDDNFGTNPIGPLVVTDGPVLFDGDPTSSNFAPTFKLGTFDLTEYQGSGTYTLRVTDIAPPVAAVPEPATWMLAIVGFGAIGVAMRRSNRRVAVRFAA